jgi:excisionase family DNA binding protein
MSDDNNTLLLRPDEVAKELALSTSKVYQMLAANELPAIHIGAAVRVPRDELRTWIRQQMREQGSPVGLEVVGGTG